MAFLLSHKIQAVTIMVNTTEKTLLDDNFTPSDNDIICSRQRKSNLHHPGNLAFHSLIDSNLMAYATAAGKNEKSVIVSDIIMSVQRKSPNAGFIKQVGNKWYVLSTSQVREKVSQAFRDKLSAFYKSSASSKRKRKCDVNAKMIEDFDAFVASNDFVSKRMHVLSSVIETHGMVFDDDQLATLMTNVNRDILNQLKKEDFRSFGESHKRHSPSHPLFVHSSPQSTNQYLQTSRI